MSGSVVVNPSTGLTPIAEVESRCLLAVERIPICQKALIGRNQRGIARRLPQAQRQ